MNSYKHFIENLISFTNFLHNLFVSLLDIVKIESSIKFCASFDCQFSIFDFLIATYFNLEKYLSIGESSGVKVGIYATFNLFGSQY